MRENNYKEVQKSIDQKYPERGKKHKIYKEKQNSARNLMG